METNPAKKKNQTKIKEHNTPWECIVILMAWPLKINHSNLVCSKVQYTKIWRSIEFSVCTLKINLIMIYYFYMDQTCSYVTFKIFFQFLKGWSIIWVVMQVGPGHPLTVKLVYLCQVLIGNSVFETSSAKDECWIHKITSTGDLLLPWKYLNAGMILFDWLEL